MAPQKFLLSQKFRHLMRCKKYLEKFFLSCLVSEIQLFVYIFGRNSKWPPERSEKGHQSSFLKFPITKIFFSSLQLIKVKIEGHMSCRVKKKILGTFRKTSVGQKQITRLVC